MNEDSMDFTAGALSPEDQLASLQTELILKEIELADARESYNEIRGTRKAIKESINEERKKSDDVIAELYKAISAEKERLSNATRDLDKAYYDMESAEFDARRAERLKQQELDSIQRQIDQARRAAMAAGEWKALEQRWDALTMGAPWREWAKDHQIEGAKKITYEGRMILGDTMGLGKTLTSLIAIDMIQAATKDASENNPIEFGSIK